METNVDCAKLVKEVMGILREVEKMPEVCEAIERFREEAFTGNEFRGMIGYALKDIREDQVLAGTWDKIEQLRREL